MTGFKRKTPIITFRAYGCDCSFCTDDKQVKNPETNAMLKHLAEAVAQTLDEECVEALETWKEKGEQGHPQVRLQEKVVFLSHGASIAFKKCGSRGRGTYDMTMALRCANKSDRETETKILLRLFNMLTARLLDEQNWSAYTNELKTFYSTLGAKDVVSKFDEATSPTRLCEIPNA